MKSLFKTPWADCELKITNRAKAGLKTGDMSQFHTDPF